MRLTGSREGGREQAGRNAQERSRPAGLLFRPGKQKKEGPAVSGGPLGYPWWSLGGSNP